MNLPSIVDLKDKIVEFMYCSKEEIPVPPIFERTLPVHCMVRLVLEPPSTISTMLLWEYEKVVVRSVIEKLG